MRPSHALHHKEARGARATRAVSKPKGVVDSPRDQSNCIWVLADTCRGSWRAGLGGRHKIALADRHGRALQPPGCCKSVTAGWKGRSFSPHQRWQRTTFPIMRADQFGKPSMLGWLKLFGWARGRRFFLRCCSVQSEAFGALNSWVVQFTAPLRRSRFIHAAESLLSTSSTELSLVPDL